MAKKKLKRKIELDDISEENEIIDNDEDNFDVVKKKKKKPHKIFKGILYTIFLFMFLGILAVAGAATAFFIMIAVEAPEFQEAKLYKSEPSVIYDIKGNAIATIGTEDRVLLTYDELPEVLVNAIVATEDSRFFQHNGVDLPRFLVASAQAVVGHDGGGASTLTMQISKNIYTSKEATGWEGIKRKFTDVYLSVFKIEPTYSKQEIVQFYVNSFFLGNGYGVEVTSKNYFGKSAKDLNLAEAAMIAGLFQAPGTYNPYINPEATEERRLRVLQLMKRHGYITDDEYEIAKKMNVEKIVEESSGKNDIGSGIVNNDYQLFVDMVIQDVTEKTGESPYTKSMNIYTTLDPTLQKHVSDIMNGKTYKWENKKVQAGVAVVDIETGAISAIGGGRNIKAAGTLNRAKNLKKQIGSTSKPLYDYGPAIEYLNWSTASILYDGPYTYSGGVKINNWDGGYKGFNTIQYHLADSRNIPALKAFQATTNEQKIEFVTSLGLTPEIYSCDSNYRLVKNKCINKDNPKDVVKAKITKPISETHSIGGYNGESPLSMAAAYAAFGNGGYYNEPYSFTKIEYPDTGDVYINKTETKQVMSESTAYMITYLLQKTVTNGISQGTYKKVGNIPYAAKSGTSNFDKATMKRFGLRSSAVNDLWMVGYNTQYAIGVWYGYDKIQDGANTFGSTQNAKLFQAVAKEVFTDKSDFDKPDSIVKVKVEKDYNMMLLPSDDTPSNYKQEALFIAGTEPNKISTRFQQLNNPSNVRATDNGDGTATVTWTKIATPDALNQGYISGLLTKSSLGKDADKYANNVLNKNKSLLGNIGYSIYVDDTLVGWTESDSYQVSSSNGTHKVTVKSAYEKYKANMSSGMNASLTISGAAEAPTPEPEPIDPNQDEQNNDSNENSNQIESNSNENQNNE